MDDLTPRPSTLRHRVLVIEDDADIAEAITWQLDKRGLHVTVADTGEKGLELALRGVDLVLLDLNLPGVDGLEVCRLLRHARATARVPIIVVSARCEEIDRVLGLEIGASDYVVKPFSLKELAARCAAALRRSEAPPEGTERYRDANFAVEFDTFSVVYRGHELALTVKEFEIFRVLLENAGRVLTRERLLQKAWGGTTFVDLRTVDAHVRGLRQKLGEGRHHIETTVGIGYRFVAEPRTGDETLVDRRG